MSERTNERAGVCVPACVTHTAREINCGSDFSFVIEHVFELSLGSAEEGGRHQLQNVAQGVVQRERNRMALDQVNEETERHECNQIANTEGSGKANQALLEG